MKELTTSRESVLCPRSIVGMPMGSTVQCARVGISWTLSFVVLADRVSLRGEVCFTPSSTESRVRSNSHPDDLIEEGRRSRNRNRIETRERERERGRGC